MAEKPVTLDELLNTDTRPLDTVFPEREAGREPSAVKPIPKKRVGEKRLTLALDGETYRRLRLHAATTDETHQDILERALTEYLSSVGA
ncbi:CopG family transcriptional regulator [Paracoccus jeotgali]|uniref:CopG family transcriptional regulator n=1 Tax=Paracoccus jeotgali TaxID=2065379 RepID=A0A2K9MJS8_9RHOB|nr:CopG family transcriptional regulator [Paracoccus jeotgali]AUM75880.1 CopG family transcriptional regulator [Paracoccus jeotgali]